VYESTGDGDKMPDNFSGNCARLGGILQNGADIVPEANAILQKKRYFRRLPPPGRLVEKRHSGGFTPPSVAEIARDLAG
jgi:hypothetical protein